MIPKTFLIDFDGTIAMHSYPSIGPEVPHAVRVLKRLQDAGHTLILLTMRCDELLEDAKKWSTDKGIDFKYVNCNPEFETGSRKVYGHYSIDDHNIGIELRMNPMIHPKPYIDWNDVEIKLELRGLL